MSIPSRSSRSSPSLKSSSTSSTQRKLVISFLILVSLILVGTVIVLSSVSYYLAFPPGAFLTEEEVPWTGKDIIRPLKNASTTEVHQKRRIGTEAYLKRQEWEEIGTDSSTKVDHGDGELGEELDTGESGNAIMGIDTIPAVWDELADEQEEEKAGAFKTTGPGSTSTPQSDVVTTTPSESESSDMDLFEEEQVSDWQGGWGIDGEGSGGYWMRAGWDGQVKDTKSWERLYDVTTRPGEKIPRLIHQTWKNDVLPEKWRKAWKECREGMPDYEYFLWTDELSREFIAAHYPSFLEIYDSYKYTIQRADSIRYFILHHFGGIYMDLDIGCRRRMDELIKGDWEVILPVTKPVGISNDLIFSSKGSEFMADTINGLPAFNHEWFSNYPTVMFSTGPMFLSAQYAAYSSAHPASVDHPRSVVRILPKSLYGKNAPPAAVPHSFFSHFYGSSWHADDAGFIGFLGSSGITVMYIAGAVVFLLVVRLAWQKYHTRKYGSSPSSSSTGYQLLPVLPTSSALANGGSPTLSNIPGSEDLRSMITRAGNIILAAPATVLNSRGRRRQGLLYFVPAMFHPTSPGGNHRNRRNRTASDASQLPIAMRRRGDDGDSISGSEGDGLPPPYQRDSYDLPSGAKSKAQGKVRGKDDEGMDEVDAFLKEQETTGEEEAIPSLTGLGLEPELGSASTSSGTTRTETEKDTGDKDWEEWQEDK